MVRFLLEGKPVETLDDVRYRAVVRFADRISGPGQGWELVRKLGRGEAVPGGALLDELDRLAKQNPPEDLAPMIGNIRNDVLRELRADGKLGPAE